MIRGLRTEFSPKKSSELDVGQLIAAPLIAASNANSVMAKEQARFLLEFCFSKEGNNYKPVMIDMYLSRSVMEAEDDSEETQKLRRVSTIFQVPLMTIIPINSLAVETVDVEFDLEISSQRQSDHKAEAKRTGQKGSEQDEEDKTGGLFKSQDVNLRGKISYDSKEAASRSDSSKSMRRNSSKLKVKIHAGQLPIPMGVSLMLDAYSKNMHPTHVHDSEKNEEENPDNS
jgi:hypothetical protein